MKTNQIVPIAILVIAVAAGAFFGGMKFDQYQRTTGRGNRQFTGGLNGGQPMGRNGLGGRPITGDIIKKDDTSITVKTQDGSSRIIMVSGQTIYNKTSEAAFTDLALGEKVGVFGTENSDKSITAQNIQLNPQFRMGPTPGK